jgi:chromate transporter
MQPPRRPIPTKELFGGFFTVGVSGFGGVLPFIRRMIVDQRGWLTAAEFTDMLALCQFLPGPNVCNLAVTLGSRERGVRGALAAVFGLLAAPFAIVIGLGLVFDRFSAIPAVAHALAGLAAAAAGLVLATALRIAGPLWGRRLGMAVAAVSFTAIALLRLPLLPTLLLLVPASILLHARPGLR